MANVELSESYINDTMSRFERDARLDKVKTGVRRALVLIFSAYGFDAATCRLVSDEFEGHNSNQ